MTPHPGRLPFIPAAWADDFTAPLNYTFRNHFFFHMNQTTRNMVAIKAMANKSDAFIELAKGTKTF